MISCRELFFDYWRSAKLPYIGRIFAAVHQVWGMLPGGLIKVTGEITGILSMELAINTVLEFI